RNMWRAAARAHRNTPVRLTWTTLSQSPSGWSTAGWRSPIPAPATRMSIPPCRAAIALIAASTAASSPTSAASAEAISPSSRAAASAAAASRSTSATAAPARTKISAVARPMPRAPPVTTATLPSRRNGSSARSGIVILPLSSLGGRGPRRRNLLPLPRIMALVLYNSLTRRKAPFAPLDPSKVPVYVCGSTVYDEAHIGNARAVVAFDLLYRVLRHTYGDGHVTYVRNITDVEDKIMARARESGQTIDQVTQVTTAIFHQD